MLLLGRPIDLLEEGIDVAVRIGRLRDASLIARPVGAVREVVVASPTFLRQFGQPAHPSALVGVPCVRFLGLASETHWTFGRGSSGVEVPVSARLVCNQAAVMVQACVDGLGFGRVRAGRLALVLEPFEPPPVPVTVLYPPNRAPSARVRAVVECLVEGRTPVLATQSIETLAE